MEEQWTIFIEKDSPGNDIKHIPGKTPEELMALANEMPNCVAFNTLGYFKSSAKDIKFVDAIKGHSLFVRKQYLEFDEVLKSFKEKMLRPFSVTGTVLQPVGKEDDVWYLLRDDFNLIYDKIVSIGGQAHLEKLLSKIFVRNYVHVDTSFEYDADFYPNLVLNPNIKNEVWKGLDLKKDNLLLVLSVTVDEFLLLGPIMKGTTQTILNIKNISNITPPKFGEFVNCLLFLAEKMILVSSEILKGQDALRLTYVDPEFFRKEEIESK